MPSYSEGKGGYNGTVSRIAPVTALVVLMAAGCGSATGSRGAGTHVLPRALAREWAARASEIADAAANGDSCRASQLAGSLRDDIIGSERKVPARLRSALVTGVNALADRISCTISPQTVTVAPAPPGPKPGGRHGPHGHHDHGHGDGKGDHG
jgi:hypothetical protein